MKFKILSLLSMTTAGFLTVGISTGSAITIGNTFVQVSDSGGGTGTNVLYNPGQTGFQIGASINSGPGYTGLFESTETITSAGGQASLKAGDGGLRDLCFSLTGGTAFTTLVLNPDVVDGQTGGTITFQLTYVTPTGGFTSGPFSLNATGQNFFQVDALNGALLTEVCWTSTVDIADANQYRIDGITTPSQSVPEGGVSVALFGLALTGIGMFGKFWKKN